MGLESLSASSASAMHRLQSNMVKAFTGYYRLKDFIYALRACKTQAAERALVAKESFAIRTGFKEECSQDHRYHSIAKLLYIHLLGYPAHYGQVECLKLAASPRLKDKRLGYFGVVLLLDEHQQTLTLVTNSLKSDLNTTNPTVIGLALSVLAAIGTEEIVYELADEVLKHLSSTNPYVRKKAGFCACRLIAKVPDLGEQFEGKLSSLLGDRNHAVVLSGLALAQSLLDASPSLLSQFRRTLAPQIVKLLTGLAASSLEYDVAGINDPFLQVRALKLLRVLGRGDAEASDAMSDVLTMMASRLDSSRNSTQAVLYEVLQTILAIRADPSLKTMAVNCLGRMLQGSEENLNGRYVALTLMTQLVESGTSIETVQRHRQTVLDCLQDPDVSIRRRAVEVAMALINRDTIRAIHAEITQHCLDDCDLAGVVVPKLAVLSAKHAPSARWYVDSLVGLLAADACTTKGETIVSSFLRIIANTPEIQAYAVSTLYTAASRKLPSSEGLVQAAAWCAGEYGHLLVLETTDPLDRLAAPIIVTAVSISELIEALESWSTKSSSSATLSYIVTALGKLSLRFESHLDKLLQAVSSIAKSCPSVRDKATETLALMQSVALRSLVFAPIPADGIGINGPEAGGSLLDSGIASPMPTDVFSDLASLSLTGVKSTLSSPRPVSGKVVYQGHGLTISATIQPSPTNTSHQVILLTAMNTGSKTISGLQILAAVPKSLRVSLDPASGSSLPPSSTVTQLLKVSSALEGKPDPAKIKLRLKLAFQLDNTPISETCDVSSLQ